MGIKTDYLKDCTTLETITIQEIVNLKRNSLSTSTLDGSLSSFESEINDKFKTLKNDIDTLFSEYKTEVDKKITDVEDELLGKLALYDEKLKIFEDEINKKLAEFKIKLDEIYNKVVQFQFFTTDNIQRNKNNDIIKIIYTNKYSLEIDYINLTYSDTYENYFPSKLIYSDDKGTVLAIEQINIRDNSIIGLSNKEM